MDTKLLKSGETTPVTGNYRFIRHQADVKDCFPRHGSYLHLKKGIRLPVHDDCLEPCLWLLMTVTEDNVDAKTKAMP